MFGSIVIQPVTESGFSKINFNKYFLTIPNFCVFVDLFAKLEQ